MSEQALLRQVERVYANALDPDFWSSFAGHVANMMEADSCIVRINRDVSGNMATRPDIVSVVSATANIGRRAGADYAAHYHKDDPWYARGWRLGLPAIVLGQELIEERAVMRTSWADFMKATEVKGVLGMQFPLLDGLIGVIGIHSRKSYTAFDESDRKKAAILLPHFQRALQIRQRLGVSECRGAFTFEILDNLSVAVLLTAADGRLLFANRSGDRFLGQHESLVVECGRVHPWRARQRAVFARAVADAAGVARLGEESAAGGLLYLERPQGGRKPVLVAPMRPGRLDIHSVRGGAAAILFSGSARDPHGKESHFIEHYALTQAEARLLVALSAGRTLAEYAFETKVSLATVQTHLKSLFRKTDCHRQSDLVRMVLSDPVWRLIPEK